MIKIKIIFILTFLITFTSCQGAKDALQGKKRSQTSEEFLIEKKNPLIMPPDIEDLPSPRNEGKAQKEEKNYIKKLLTNNESSTSSNSSANDTKSSIEKTIIEKIQN